MRGRNTENSITKIDFKTANYQKKRYVLMNLFHKEKHIVFSDTGEGGRKMEILDGVEVVVSVR